MTNNLNLGDISTPRLRGAVKHFSQLQVLMERIGVFPWVNIPLGTPGLVDAEP
jgi:hypothetical protein